MKIKIKNFIHWVESISISLFYGIPIKKLKVIFVTGTDGKTTTSYMLYQVLNKLNKKTAVITTVAAKIGDKSLDTGFHTTTPSRLVLQKILRQCVKEKVEYLVIENTAHGIDQNRIVFAKPVATIYTNITKNEHLDYFKTYEKYLGTKAKLIVLSQKVFINKYDTSREKLVTKCVESNKKYFIYDYKNIEKHLSVNFKKLFPGVYNLENASAVYETCIQMGHTKQSVIEALSNVMPPEGRFEVIWDTPRVIIDFAHTPNSLKNILITTKATTEGRLFVIFGCASERDTTKRPKMGFISAKYADVVLLTAEDPRKESLKKINNEITTGFNKAKTKAKLIRFDNEKELVDIRKKAIEKAIKLAGKKDTIVITGKGHEKSLCFNNIEYPWDDKQEALKILQTHNAD